MSYQFNRQHLELGELLLVSTRMNQLIESTDYWVCLCSWQSDKWLWGACNWCYFGFLCCSQRLCQSSLLMHCVGQPGRSSSHPGVVENEYVWVAASYNGLSRIAWPNGTLRIVWAMAIQWLWTCCSVKGWMLSHVFSLDGVGVIISVLCFCFI
jgi:hypothetical protein